MVQYDCAVSYSTQGGIPEATLSERRPDPKEQEQEREQDGGKESRDDILREWGERIEQVRSALEQFKEGKQEKDG